MADQPPITAPVSRRTIYTLIMLVVACIVGVGLSIGYSAQAVHGTQVANQRALELAQQNNANAIALAKQADLHNLQQICGIIVILDDAYRNPSTPPTTRLGRDLAEAIKTYRAFLGCDHIPK